MTTDMEISTDADLGRCPSCGAGNVFLTYSVSHKDSRRHVECRICQMRGPVKMSEAKAIAAWIELPRRTGLVWWVHCPLERRPETNHDLFVDEVDAREYAEKQASERVVTPLGLSP